MRGLFWRRGSDHRRARAFIADPAERKRLVNAVFEQIGSGSNTYRDRLQAMIEASASPAAAARSIRSAA